MLWRSVIGFFLLAICGAAYLPGVPEQFSTNDAILSAIADEVAGKFETEYVAYLKTGVESAALRQISAQLAKSHSKQDLFTKELYELAPADQFFACTTCRATVNVLARMFREEDGEFNGPDSAAYVKGIMLDMCDRLQLQTEEVCSGLFDSNWLTIEYIIKHTESDARSFCSLFMEFGFCNVRSPDYNWTLTIDAVGSTVTGPKSNIPAGGADNLQMLHLSDIHYDPLYLPGALAECDEPVCCQRHRDLALGTSKAAGYWGDYRNCDSPWHTIDNALQRIRKTHPQIDYIYQTGDVVDHMVWATSIEKNAGVLTKVNNRLAELFPGVPVYPCIGNHEPHPVNAFSPVDVPEEINTRWLYENLYSDWSKWLPADTKDTILKGGYYTVAPTNGFRIVALNNNDCYSDNWWLFYSGTNKIPQLEWLHDTLLAAERAGEHVHILAHIPSGDGTCWSVWSREYNRLIERFRNTVSGIFVGHSHKDEMNVHYSTNGHAIGMTWNGGSLATYANKNPNYRIYQAEPTSMQVVDHETWIFNLTETNQHGEAREPNWYQEYVFSAEFTNDLSPAGLDKLLDEMAAKPELLRKFWRYKVALADPKLQEGCDKSCLLTTICRIATTVNNQKKRCDQLTAKLSEALENEILTTEATTLSTSTSTASSSSTSTSTEATWTTEDPGHDLGFIITPTISTLIASILLAFQTIY